ncbi:MAG: methylated-DNA-[protein]-cysteine S-methyltransferase [bacterium]|jgi:methylated-DNA-[protein]-cysteine S-methyltransferase
MRDFYFFQYLDTPMGSIYLEELDNKIIKVEFKERSFPFLPIQEQGCRGEKNTFLLQEAKKQLLEYCNGTRFSFDLPLNPVGTQFQQKTWNILQEIPYGEIISYQQQAIQMGNKNFSRAVGQANRKNPIGIIIPCHRVIGKNGELRGYAGGLQNKTHLLKIEASFKNAFDQINTPTVPYQE